MHIVMSRVSTKNVAREWMTNMHTKGIRKYLTNKKKKKKQ